MNAMSDVPTPSRFLDAPQMQTYDAREIVKDGVQACIVLDGQV